MLLPLPLPLLRMGRGRVLTERLEEVGWLQETGDEEAGGTGVVAAEWVWVWVWVWVWGEVRGGQCKMRRGCSV